MTTKTRSSIEAALKEKGFTEAEIAEAFEEYLRAPTGFENRERSPAYLALRLQDRFVDHDGTILTRVLEPEN